MGCWNALATKYSLILPGIVVEEEAFYFESVDGLKQPLSPSSWIKNGQVKRVDAEIEDYKILETRFSPNFLKGIDAGEREALAILVSQNDQQIFFTTCDRAAVKALGVLRMGNKGVSFERLVNQLPNSSQWNKKLSHHHREHWFTQVSVKGAHLLPDLLS